MMAESSRDITLWKEILKLRSVIPPHFLKKKLYKGLSLAIFGIAFLLIGGTFLPIERLDRWGFVLFSLSMALITLGLLPYRRLAQLQVKPNELLFTTNEMIFIQRGKPAWSTQLTSIRNIEYRETKRSFGIVVILKENRSFYLPYFNRHAYREFEDILKFL